MSIFGRHVYMRILSFDIGIKNLAYCMFDTETNAIGAWNLVSVTRPKEDLAQGIFRTLSTAEIPSCDRVLVERQPGRNKTMLRVEAYVHMFCVAKQLAPIVELYGAIHKLKNTGVENHGRSKNMYSARKKAAVALALEFLREHPQADHIRKQFDQCKKKDDLADCLLQALSYKPGTTEQPPLLKDVKAKKPTEKQMASGKVTPSGIKYLVADLVKKTMFAYIPTDPMSTLKHIIHGDKKLTKSIERHFNGDLKECIEALQLEPILCPPLH